VVTDTVAPGAVHAYRPPPLPDHRPTAPPPKPDLRPFPRSSVVGVKVPPRAAPPPVPAGVTDEDERTIVGLGPAVNGQPEPPTEVDEDSMVKAVKAADTLAAELARRNAQVAALQHELAAAQRLPAPPATPSETPPSRAKWHSLAFKLIAAVTGLVGALTVALEVYTSQVRTRVDNVEAKVAAQEVVTKPLPAAAASADLAADACRDWARLHSDYDRQIFRKLGVVIPEPENSKPVEPIKTRAPVRRGNAVTGAPVLEVLTPPPALP
jgi:hypothetical protein